MTQAATFGAAYIAACQALVDDLENLRTLNDRIAQEPGLISAVVNSPGWRNDLSATDLNNASGAVTQLLFTFDSGSPTQKSFLFKLF
jgi:hypothetical protein